MIEIYKGHFAYTLQSVSNNAPQSKGVYYMGSLNQDGSLGVTYVGKSSDGADMRGRLLSHYNNGEWSDITHFGYRVCTTIQEADKLEADEITRLQPTHNQIGKWH